MKLKYKLLASYLILFASILTAGVFVGDTVASGHETIAVEENIRWTETYFLHEAAEHNLSSLLRSDANITQRLDDWRHVTAAEGVLAIRVWDTNFTIRHASDPTLIGRRFPDNKELSEAYKGDTVSEIDPGQSDEMIQSRGGVLELYVPIKDSDGRVVGAGEMYINFTNARTTIQTARAQVRDTFAAVTAVLTVLILILGYSLWRPLRDLGRMQAVMESLSRGEFDVELQATDRDDEIGEIARSFDRLLTSLKLAVEQTRTTEDGQDGPG